MTEQRDPDAILHDIEDTRHELADTAAAIAEKADVKARAHERVEHTKEAAREKVDDAREKVAGAATTAARQPRSHPKATAAIAILIVGVAVGYHRAGRRRCPRPAPGASTARRRARGRVAGTCRRCSP